ncbi:ubinuclein-2b isoform X1 [Alosa sapidissima]|uniref:ubinuclein-2b isoform X1 n=1 Tax=Alosa sapidissima TaxID=34773 RepID=UPI001C08E706|nr:ubinuclein-2b isoform X1 [Alosa sapidissima]
MAEQRKVPFVTLATFNTTPASEPKKRRREEETDTSQGKNGGVGSAATGPGGGGSLFGNIKGNVSVSDGTSGEPKAVTVRLNISLSEPSEKGSTEYNYGELVQSTQVKKTPQVLAPSFDPTDPFGDDARERQQVEALAKKFESKYANPNKKKRKDRIQDLVDIGYGYDETDPFIDNSEAYDELVPASLTTKLGGFYINTGTLQFRAASESEGEDGGKDGNSLKKPKDVEERVIKKRRKKQDGNLEEKKPRKIRVPKTGVLSLNRPEKKKRKKLMKDSLNLAAMLRRFAREKEEMRKKQPAAALKLSRGPSSANTTPSTAQCPPGMLNSHPQSVSAITPGGDFNMADLTTDPAVMSLLGGASENEMLQDLMGDLDFGLLDSPQPGSPRHQGENGNLAPAGMKAGGAAAALRGQRGLLNPPPLPNGLPGPLIKRIEDLRAASRQFDQEGRKKFFTLDMNNILLDIELQVQEQPTESRSAIYSHLEAFVPCNKEALLKRLKKLSLNIQDDRLRTPLLKLKLAVCSVMPEQIARYNMDCMARVAKQQSEEGEKNGSEEEDEEKPGKRVMGPRKKFLWDDKLRNLLCSLVRVKLGCYEREGQNSLSAEDYLKAFMETEVKPLWPKGWMQARMLFKESRMAHSHLTGNSVKKRIVPTPKAKSKEVGWVQKSAPLVDLASPLALAARQHAPPESEPICLSDSLDEDLATPSLDSISQALALLSNAAKDLIHNEAPSGAAGAAQPQASPLLHKKGHGSLVSSGHYVSTSFSPAAAAALAAASSASRAAAAHGDGMGLAKGSPLAQAHRHSAMDSARTPTSKASMSPSGMSPSSSVVKARPPPTASPLLPPQHKAFGLPGSSKAGKSGGPADSVLGGTAVQARGPHMLLSPHHLPSKAPPQQQGAPQDSVRASPAPSPPQPRTPPTQQQQQPQPQGFITPMQATLTKSSHSSSSPILKLTPRPPAPTSASPANSGSSSSPAVASQARPAQTLPVVHQYVASSSSSTPSSKAAAFRPPLSGTLRGQGNFTSSAAGQKTPSQVTSSPSVSKHAAAAASPTPSAASPANHGQRQRSVGGTGAGAKPITSVSSASATPQLSQVSSAGSALLGSAGPSLPLGFGMLGGLVPVSLPFQFPSLLNLAPPGVTSATAGTGPSVTSSSAYALTQNLLKSLQSGSQAALPPHLQLAFPDVSQTQGGDLKRKPL